MINIDNIRSLIPHVDVYGDKSRWVRSIARWDNAHPLSLIWFDGRTIDVCDKISKTESKCIILSSVIKNVNFAAYPDKMFIISPTARLDFITLAKELESEENLIHPSAVITNTHVGKNVSIKAGAVIGSDGFGFEMNSKGEWVKFPHKGSVILGDDVQIGALTTVDRGALGDTYIGPGTKVDNHCHIGHNVVIGENCLITAKTLLCGSCEIGDEVYIAPGVIVRDKVKIGNNAFIGMGSIVTKDIPAHELWMGSPAAFVRKN